MSMAEKWYKAFSGKIASMKWSSQKYRWFSGAEFLYSALLTTLFNSVTCEPICFPTGLYKADMDENGHDLIRSNKLNILETERLILRTWNESDILPFSIMNGDNQVMEFFPNILSKEETFALYERITTDIERRGFGLFAVEAKQTQDFMGFIGFDEPRFSSYFTPCVEIGWRLDKRFWDQGYATEGAKACLEYGFSTLGFKEVVSFTSKLNTKSIAVMKNIGMTYESDFEHPKVVEGHPLRTHVLYRISRRSWSFTLNAELLAKLGGVNLRFILNQLLRCPGHLTKSTETAANN